MKNNFIVGLSGPQGAGKSFLSHAVADAIGEHTCYDISGKVFSLAAPLYEMSSIMLGETVDKQKTYAIGVNNPKEATGRHVLQHLGTEVGRYFHSEIWIWNLLNRVSGESNPNLIPLIDDVRFMNEREIVDLHIWVEPSTMIQKQIGHESEQAQQELKSSSHIQLIRDVETGKYFSGDTCLSPKDIAVDIWKAFKTFSLAST